MEYSCPVMSCVTSLEINQITLHVNSVHSNDASIDAYYCKLCKKKSYSRVTALVSHLKDKHRPVSSISDSANIPSSLPTNTNPSNDLTNPRNLKRKYAEIDSPESLSSETCMTRQQVEHPQSSSASSYVFNDGRMGSIIRENTFNFIMQLHANTNLSRSLASDIAESVRTYTKLIFTETLNYVDSSNNAYNIVDSVSQVIDQCFANSTTDHLFFSKLSSEEPRYIEPVTTNISAELGRRKVNGKNITEIKNIEVQIIPMKKILKEYLSIPNAFETIIKYIEQCKTKSDIMSIYQGHVWKNIEAKFIPKIVLPLLLYSDDFEVNNALGTHQGCSQLCGVYFSLLCIPDEYRSSLENILVAQIHKTVDQKNCGNHRIFSNLVEQLKELEEKGIELEINGEKIQVYFALLVVAGDNLGLNKMLGFIAAFNADYCCRFCTATISEINKSVKITQKKLRNESQYAQHLEKMSYGLKDECIFNQLESYHVFRNINTDSGHDLRLGICQYVLGKEIHYFITEKCFDLETLNSKIQGFDYGSSPNINKPQKIKQTHVQNKYIRGTASEIYTMMVYFGFWVGPFITDEKHKEVWEIYLLLRKIMLCIESHSFSLEKIDQLRLWINKFLTLYSKYFGHLVYKFHNLLHYPDMILAMGPPRFYSTLRFESEHQVIKKILTSTKSRVNPALTAAKKLQVRQCSNFKNSKGFSSKLKHGPHTNKNIKDFIEDISHLTSINTGSEYIATKWVSVFGTYYAENMYIDINSEKNEKELFGKIEFIIINADLEVFFIYQKLDNVVFSDHVQGFEIGQETNNEWGEIKQTGLIMYKPRVRSKLYDGKEYIISL